VIRYGSYERSDLFEVARRSRACVYSSRDDRGPLALAEILLAGCPAIGIPRGAPFIEEGRTGTYVKRLTLRGVTEALERVWRAGRDRSDVRLQALSMFDTERTLDTILQALDAARRRP
jgi:hypothetical protein